MLTLRLLSRRIMPVLLLLALLLTVSGCGGGATATPELPTEVPLGDNPPGDAATPDGSGNTGGDPLNPTVEVADGANPENLVTQPFSGGLAFLLTQPAETPILETVTAQPTIEGALVPGGVGTMVVSATEDPDAGVPFLRIRLERSLGPLVGGAPLPPMVIELNGNGGITVNGKSGTVTQQVLDQLNAQIREMNYFGISGDFLGVTPVEGTDEYLYVLTVERGDLLQMLTLRDRLMPQPLRTFVALLVQEGNRLGG